MDLGSTEGLEKLGDLQKQDVPALGGELDLNFQVDKDDKADDCVYEKRVRNDKIQVDLNEQQGQLGFPSLPSDFRYGGSQTPCEKSHSPVQTETDHDVVMGTKFDYDQERSHSPSNNQHPYRREMELHDSFLRKSSSASSIDTFQNEMGTEDYAHSREFLLTVNANQGEEMEEKSNLDRPTSPPHDEKIKEIISEKSQYELTKSVYAEIEGEATEHQTGKLFSSSRLQLGSTESKNENFHYSRSSPTESRNLDKPHSCQQSPKRTPKQLTSPVTGRQMTVSPEKSPCIELSPSVRKPSSSKQGVEDPLFSPRSHKHKHSSSPERSDLGKSVPSQNHLSPARRTSASPRGTRQRSQLKDGSSLKHGSELAKTHYSPPNYRRQARSRSPTQRRDSSSGYKRDYHDRSRSRSPYTRDSHRRSPRRRYSPRRRSPPSVYHSRHRSPRKRPWSPPSNRSTGIGKPGKNLFVAGFSFSTTERDLERKFSRFGRVQDVRIVRDKRSGDSRGFGFLSLERDEDADAAIRALDKTDWNGRIVLVEKSKSSVR